MRPMREVIRGIAFMAATIGLDLMIEAFQVDALCA